MRPRVFGGVNYGLRRQVTKLCGGGGGDGRAELNIATEGGRWRAGSAGQRASADLRRSLRLLVDRFFGCTSFYTIHAPFAFARRKREDEETTSGVHLPIA